MAPLPSWLNLQFVAPTLAGVVLLIVGLRGRRHGRTPYCTSCGYNLIGSVVERCPECGMAFTAQSVTYGERKRRPLIAAVGAGLLLLAALAVCQSVWHVDWYQWYPDAGVVSDLRSSKNAVAQRALAETKRRLKNKSWHHMAMLADACLAEQGSAQPGPVGQRLIGLLGELYLTNSLSPAQEAKYLAQMVRLSLRLRPQVVLGDDLPCQVGYDVRNGNAPIRLILTTQAWAINGQPVPNKVETAIEESHASGRHSKMERCKVVAAGPLEMSVRLRLRIYPFPAAAGASTTTYGFVEDRVKQWGPPIHDEVVELQGKSTVLATEPADYIKTVRDPLVDQMLLNAAKGTKVDLQRGKYWDSQKNAQVAGWAQAGYEFTFGGDQRLTMNVAADVVVRIQGRDYPAGYCEATKDDNLGSFTIGIQGLQYDGQPVQSADLIIRTNRRRARDTVDMFEIWEGEVIAPDFALRFLPDK